METGHRRHNLHTMPSSGASHPANCGYLHMWRGVVAGAVWCGVAWCGVLRVHIPNDSVAVIEVAGALLKRTATTPLERWGSGYGGVRFVFGGCFDKRWCCWVYRFLLR